MMDDLISRQAAIETLLAEGLITAAVYIERMPSADLFEYSDKLWKTAYERGKAEAYPKKGKWMYRKNDMWECSECENIIYSETKGDRKYFHAYCGRCGAKMEENDG